MNSTLHVTYVFQNFQKKLNKMDGQNCTRKIMVALKMERREEYFVYMNIRV